MVGPSHRLACAGLLAALSFLPMGATAAAQQVVERTAPVGQRSQGWIGLDAEWFYDTWRVGEPRSAPAMVVMGVYPESPAARAGLQVGDTVVRLSDGPAVPEVFERWRLRLQPGSRVSLTYRRAGRENTVPLQAATRPSQDQLVTIPEQVKLRVDSIQSLFVRYFDSTSRAGAPEAQEGGRVLLFRIPDDGSAEAVAAAIRGVFPFPALAFDSLVIRIETLAPNEAPFEVAVRPSQQVASPQGARARRAPPQAPSAPRSSPQTRASADAYRPLAPYIAGEDRIAGARFTSLNAGLAGYFGVRRGLLVVDVAVGTPASDAGIAPGDVITHAGTREVTTLEELRTALASSGAPDLRLTLVRKGRLFPVALRR